MTEPTTPEPAEDPGHLLPEDVWAKVVADAESHARRMAAPKAATGIITKTIPAYAHGGAISGPTLIVVHDAETPLKAGYATSLATNWFGTSAAGTSAHAIADPADLIQMLPDDVVAWHVGPNGNAFTLGIEQAGYARFTRAEWTTADGMAQMARVGAWVRMKALAHGIPLRWANDDQIRAAARGVKGGVCHHDDIRRVLGGTTHVDPMPDYPDDLLAQAWGSDPAPVEDDMPRFDLIRNKDNGLMVLAAPGIWRGLSNSAYVTLVASMKLVNSTTPDLDVPTNEFAFLQSVYLSGAPSIDPDAIADAVAAKIAPSAGGLTLDEVKEASKEAVTEVLTEGVGASANPS